MSSESESRTASGFDIRRHSFLSCKNGSRYQGVPQINLWIDNENVEPWYVDCDEGSKSQMFIEGGDFATSQTVDDAMTLTRTVLPLYQTYLGQNLTGPNLLHFQNATGHQVDALQELQDSDVEGYIDSMNLSYQEYMGITP